MADMSVQLKDKDGNNVYPVSSLPSNVVVSQDIINVDTSNLTQLANVLDPILNQKINPLITNLQDQITALQAENTSLLAELNNTKAAIRYGSNTNFISRASTTYCSSYKSGNIGYSITNGICIISFWGLTINGQGPNFVEVEWTGFPKMAHGTANMMGCCGAIFNSEGIMYEGENTIRIRFKDGNGVYGHMVYVIA